MFGTYRILFLWERYLFITAMQNIPIKLHLQIASYQSVLLFLRTQLTQQLHSSSKLENDIVALRLKNKKRKPAQLRDQDLN